MEVPCEKMLSSESCQELCGLGMIENIGWLECIKPQVSVHVCEMMSEPRRHIDTAT